MNVQYLWILLFFSASLFSHVEELESVDVVESEDEQALVDFLPYSTKLKEKDLIKKRQTSLGDTLSQEVGVQSTQFGPNVSRPVVRGLDGDRIRILQNGLGTMDASAQSLDHAIPVDPLSLDQVEINRGPMSLLYGSSAVGGVINLVTNRIHYQFEEGFFSKVQTQGETVNTGLSSVAHLNYGKKYGNKKWMYHLDASTRNLADVKIPSSAASTSKEVIPNSFNQQDQLSLATSHIFDQGYLGISFNHFNSHYGSVTEEEVSIKMTQNRFELHGEFRPETSSIRKIKLKSTQSDYLHREFEGEISGTLFKNKGNESRLEIITHNKNWNGVTGIHTKFSQFASEGEEAFLPVSKNRNVSAFTFMQYSQDAHAFRFGARLEEFQTKKQEEMPINYTAQSFSLGHCYDFSKKHKLESSLSYTERPPTFQELFSDGPHIATGTEERGDRSLRKEKATSLDIHYDWATSKNVFTLGLFGQYFYDYISLNPTGNMGEEFEIYEYQQVDAIFYGLELENRFLTHSFSRKDLFLSTKFDYLKAKELSNDVGLPRISPIRLSVGLEMEGERLRGDIETQFVFSQKETAPEETPTDGYILTQLGLSYQVLREHSSINIFFRIRNIFDVVARNHVSFAKERAPLPGRNAILGFQYQM